MTRNIEIITLPVGQMQSNCYLLVDKKTYETLIIDPGDDGDFIIRTISDKKLKPIAVVATHGHFDHIMAVTELTLAYGIPFWASKADEFLIHNMQDSAFHFLHIKTDPAPVIDSYLKKDIRIGSIKLHIIETPGHTPGSVCLYSPEGKILFCGDLLFAGGAVGRTDFSYSETGELKESLKRVFQLPDQTAVYPGHGAATTIAKERKMLIG